jgi:diaminopimelate epimerase
MLFTKMHGLGNDFIIIDGLERPIDYKALAKRLCSRHTSIGADGLIIVLPSEKADIRMQIINSDGSEAEMCGNGIRCFAKYVFEKGFVRTPNMTVETLAGIMEPELILDNGDVTAVRVNMGKPRFSRRDIPMRGDGEKAINAHIDVNGKTYDITSMFMGVPHTMLFVNKFDENEICTLGPAIERHEIFPQHTNVNFVKIISHREIEVRTWERGAGRTLACGTGSCAAAVASFLNGYTGRNVTVQLALGELDIEWAADDTVYMSGPAEEAYIGEVNI